MWQVLWTRLPCHNFTLLICVAILDTEKSSLMQPSCDASEILKVTVTCSVICLIGFNLEPIISNCDDNKVTFAIVKCVYALNHLTPTLIF